MEKIEYKGVEYELVFNLNVMEEIQEEYGSIEAWADLTDADEPNIKALKFGLLHMINEGIDIFNEENNETRPFFDSKKIGRLLTEVGLDKAVSSVSNTVIESTKSNEKN